VRTHTPLREGSSGSRSIHPSPDGRIHPGYGESIKDKTLPSDVLTCRGDIVILYLVSRAFHRPTSLFPTVQHTRNFGQASLAPAPPIIQIGIGIGVVWIAEATVVQVRRVVHFILSLLFDPEQLVPVPSEKGVASSGRCLGTINLGDLIPHYSFFRLALHRVQVVDFVSQPLWS
jgi:hypothetical protein